VCVRFLRCGDAKTVVLYIVERESGGSEVFFGFLDEYVSFGSYVLDGRMGLGMGFGILGSSISRFNYEWTLEGIIEQVVPALRKSHVFSFGRRWKKLLGNQ